MTSHREHYQIDISNELDDISNELNSSLHRTTYIFLHSLAKFKCTEWNYFYDFWPIGWVAFPFRVEFFTWYLIDVVIHSDLFSCFNISLIVNITYVDTRRAYVQTEADFLAYDNIDIHATYHPLFINHIIFNANINHLKR